MAKTPSATRSLDENEQRLVEQSKNLKDASQRELTELARQLRQRRERVQRMIRQRNRTARRDGVANPDTGARDKRAELVKAIDRVHQALEARKPVNRATEATANLKAAVKRKSQVDTTKHSGQTADKGPSETPNEKIAPSGALHAEGHRPALGRARGR